MPIYEGNYSIDPRPMNSLLDLLKKPVEGIETLERLKRYPSKREAMVGLKVKIYSGEHRSYWVQSSNGYTSYRDQAGIFLFDDALSKTYHCDPSKKIIFCIVNQKDDPEAYYPETIKNVEEMLRKEKLPFCLSKGSRCITFDTAYELEIFKFGLYVAFLTLKPTE